MAQHLQINKLDIPHYRMKHKNHTTILIDEETAFDNIQHPFIIKILNKLAVEDYLSFKNLMSEKPIPTMLSGEN
jgi:hypothetical protein